MISNVGFGFSSRKKQSGGMSALKESTRREENDSMSGISENLTHNQTFCLGGSVLEPSVQYPRENMTPNSDQADLLTHVRFIESICADGPAKAAYVNGSASPNISDEILLDISKNVPGFLPKSLHAQTSSVPTGVQFEECDPLRKDGEMTIKQMLTAEDVENRGIWGFDEESPENSLDCYDDGNELSWNPQKEFMKFLLEDNDHSETEEKMPTIPPAVSHRRRKRKMDMVVMVDPSEEFYTDSSNDHLNEDSHMDHGSVNKVDPQWKRHRSHSPVSKTTQYSNGTAAAFKHLFSKPAKNKKSQKLGFVRENLSDSGSEEEPMFFPSNSKVKEKSHPRRRVKLRPYVPDQKAFICKVCGRSFFDHSSFLGHIAVHKKKRQKIKETDGPKDEGKDASLQCPQCTFGTNCPNTFVQHAKTHEKDKRYYRCQKCPFMAMNEFELRGHMLCKHHVTDAQYVQMSKQDGFQAQKVGASGSNPAPSHPILFSCKECSFKTRNKNILRNHCEGIHQQIFGGDLEDDLHFTRNCEIRDNTSSVQSPSLCKLPSVGSQSPERFLSQDSRKKESSKSDAVPSLIQKDKTKRKDMANDKLAKNESRLYKSISTLLSGKRRSQQKTSGTDTNQKTDKKRSVTDKSLGVDKCCRKDSLDPETTLSVKEGPKSPSKNKGELFALQKSPTSMGRTCEVSNNDYGSQEKSRSNHKHLTLVKPSLKKSPSKRKMSTPFHNMQGQDILIDFPKCRQNLKKKEATEKCEKDRSSEDEFLHDSTHNSSFHLTEKCDIKGDSYINSQFSRKRSAPTKGSLRASSGHSEQDLGSLRKFSIKEECIETEVCNRSSPEKSDDSTDFETDLKSCPYCPAKFESGISLSNHIRGHLHRVGLNYNERHETSVAQVVSTNKVPQVRRRMATVPQVKTEEDHPDAEQMSEEQSELTCPLCREWFDSRTGLSNHVRGHLKKLRTSLAANKSPVDALKELMRDKKQFHMKLQALEKKCRASNRLYPFRISNGLIYSTAKVQRFRQSDKRPGQISPQSGDEKKRTEVKDVTKGSPSSDLIGILKKRRAHEEAKVKSSLQTARKALLVSPIKDRSPLIQQCKALPNSISEKNEHNRKVCAHCNTTFPSGVSLSNHLRAYARRKRNALMEGTTYDCKQRKQRSRSGSKKKNYPLLHTPEEIYRLTCRFCDLVFQGPLSVQEDWVKHLQRHIMNTAVPRTGAGMVEVTCFPKDPGSDTETQAKPCS